MNLRPKTLLLALLAILGAAWLTPREPEPSYEAQLIGVALHQSFGSAAPELAAQPLEVQALLLDYAGDEALVLQTRLALLKYPDLARRVLPRYGSEPEFREVLSTYGPGALPPIAYFMDHSLTSLEARRALGERLDQVKEIWDRWFGSAPPAAEAQTQAQTAELTPDERGWYAIAFLREEGYGFIEQFTVTKDGKAEWVQTERFVKMLSDLLLGGVQGLETKWRQGSEVQIGDVAWAALDVAVIAGSVKLVKALGAARAARVTATGVPAAAGMGFSGRVALFGSRILAQGGRVGLAVARYGAIPAGIYLMIRHPALINATLAELAGWVGISPWAVQFLFWFVALSVVGRLALFLLRPLGLALAWAGGRRPALMGRAQLAP
jgi:hypothetical protein